jgi:hypothetical protein
MVRIVWNYRQCLTMLDVIMFVEQMRSLDQETLGLFADKVIVESVSAFTFRDQSEDVAYARGLIFCSRR